MSRTNKINNYSKQTDGSRNQYFRRQRGRDVRKCQVMCDTINRSLGNNVRKKTEINFIR